MESMPFPWQPDELAGTHNQNIPEMPAANRAPAHPFFTTFLFENWTVNT